MIAKERARQIKEEGMSAEHDDMENGNGELSMAGAMYAQYASYQCKHPAAEISRDLPREWPDAWSDEWWKPSIDIIRNLTKAGALIAAEIDRLQRRAAKGTSEIVLVLGAVQGSNMNGTLSVGVGTLDERTDVALTTKSIMCTLDEYRVMHSSFLALHAINDKQGELTAADCANIARGVLGGGE